MKRILVSCLIAFSGLTVLADTLTIRKLFVEMPETVIPYLTKNNRLDLLDFMDSNMKAEVTNELGGKTMMTALADDSISIRLNEAGKVDILLLSTTNPVDSCDKVICMLYTIGAENKYEVTEIEFFSVQWRRLAQEPALVAADKERVREYITEKSVLRYLLLQLNKDVRSERKE